MKRNLLERVDEVLRNPGKFFGREFEDRVFLVEVGREGRAQVGDPGLDPLHLVPGRLVKVQTYKLVRAMSNNKLL